MSRVRTAAVVIGVALALAIVTAYLVAVCVVVARTTGAPS